MGGSLTKPFVADSWVMSQIFTSSFKNLAWANLAAQSAEQLSLAATPIVAVLLLGAGAGEVGLMATAQTLPFLLFSLPLGVLSDRYSRRALMLWAEGLRGLALLCLLILVLTGQVSIWALTLLGFLGALGTVGFSVAAPALVPALVPPSELSRANGRLELARSTAYAAGPALAGTLVAWAGASLAFTLATGLSASALVLLWRLSEPARPRAVQRHPLQELKDGARFMWQDPQLKVIFKTAVAWNIAWFVLQAAYVPYAFKVLGLSAATVGVTLGAFGVGMVTGAVLAPRTTRLVPLGRAIQIGPTLSLASSLTMASTLLWPSEWLAVLSYLLIGLGSTTWVITSTTLRQTVTPPTMLGRVGAIFLTCNMGARPLGAALGGLVGARFGESACIGLSLALFALQFSLILRPAISQLKALPEQAK